MISRRLLRIKVIKSLYCHYTTEGSSLALAQKNTLFSIGKSYDLYHLLLSLVVDVQKHAAEVIDARRTKLRPTEEDLNPNTKFVENRLIAMIDDCEPLNTYLEKSSLTWVQYPLLIKQLYNNMVSKPYYTEYMNSGKNSFAEDKELVLNFLKNEIEDFDYMYDVLEEISIFWMDEIEFIASQVIRTLSFVKATDESIVIPPLYKDMDDQYFVKDLVAKTLLKREESLEYMSKYTQNWDVERIAFMDRLIIMAAMTELTEFSDIPVKVTMDEYIEIAKYYSTPNSRSFVNGMLDKIVANLNADGKINKSGRGLI